MNKNNIKNRINPLSRLPRHQRLVMAIRGGAGTGKSHFARSMFQAGLGRLCIFDTERKSRLLKGVGTDFDGLEIQYPDELPEFIDWAIQGEGAQRNYGCFVLDSWAAYFSAKHSETIAAIRENRGNSLAQPTSEELAGDQMILQGVLRKLCIESGKSVIIVDQIPARGKEIKEDNEVGRVLPMTASGLEYFVDLMVELSLQERDGELVRVFQVVKSNSPAFEIGFELTGDITFRDFLDHLTQENGTQFPVNVGKPESDIPTWLSSPEIPFTPKITIQNLIHKATQNGFKQADLVTAARVYYDQSNIYRLTTEQLENLDQRLSAKINKIKSTNLERSTKPMKKSG